MRSPADLYRINKGATKSSLFVRSRYAPSLCFVTSWQARDKTPGVYCHELKDEQRRQQVLALQRRSGIGFSTMSRAVLDGMNTPSAALMHSQLAGVGSPLRCDKALPQRKWSD
jgi:hypothetical protein